jgi:hypothetical protein
MISGRLRFRLRATCSEMTGADATQAAPVDRAAGASGTIGLLEYVMPRNPLRRLSVRVWKPWVAGAYGAGFDRNTATHIPEAGLELMEARFVVDDLMQMLTARVPG